jgi:hypothetical protein
MRHFPATPVKSDRREFGVAPSCPGLWPPWNVWKRHGNSQSHWKGDFLCSDRLHCRLQIWNATIYIDHIIFQKQMLDIWISESSSWPRPPFFSILTLCEGDGVSKMEAAGDSSVGRWRACHGKGRWSRNMMVNIGLIYMVHTYIYMYILVGGDWNIWIIFSIYWECHHPKWLIFFRGVETTNQDRNMLDQTSEIRTKVGNMLYATSMRILTNSEFKTLDWDMADPLNCYG